MKERQIEKILNTLTILYVEPSKTVAKKVQEALRLKCDNVLVAYSIQEAVEIYNDEKVDIIITEVKFPDNDNDNDGERFIKSIRNINTNIPIIVISSVKDIKVLLSMIRLNLTEYIVKPIDIQIFKEALYNATTYLYDNGYYEIRFPNGAVYNVVKKLLSKDGKNITLTPNEIRFLDFLIVNKNSVIPKDTICNYVWEDNFNITEEAFKSLLNRIRKKLGKESIKNISGYGYRLNIDED
jgi:DNA-binding response OmpR family regulator